jgi:hypothetical protein
MIAHVVTTVFVISTGPSSITGRMSRLSSVMAIPG